MDNSSWAAIPKNEGTCPLATALVARPPKVALINSIVAHNDAISASVIDTHRVLTEECAFEVALFCHKNDFAELPSHTVSNVTDLLFHPEYLAADILIWHFGVTYDLFNAALIGNGRAPRVVCFHNVTPKEFVPKRFWETIDRSLVQCHLLRGVDEIWAVSKINAETAESLGVDPGRIKDIPLIVESGPVTAPSNKSLTLITILFVGRFVPSKGVLELLAAVERLRREATRVRFHVELTGNVEFSDPDYVAKVRAFIDEKALGDAVTMHGTVDDATLTHLYTKAHILAIPSYHEGFCKPVVEALRAGCIPVGYNAYNLPYVANGFGRLVAPGDVDALQASLRSTIEALPAALQSPHEARLPLDRGMTSIASFESQIHLYVKRFGAERVGDAMRQRLNQLLSGLERFRS